MALHDEIFEQPARLAALLRNQQATAIEIANAIRARDPRFVFLAARGTSDNAGRFANYLWGAQNGLPIALATPSLFTYYNHPPRLKDALVMAVSQSGKSPDIVSVVEEGRRQGALTLSIVNVPESPLAKAADLILDIQVGEEKAVAATKSYTGQIMAIAMISVALTGDTTLWADLEKVPDWIAEVLKQDAAIKQMAPRYRYMNQCVVLGRGFNYATAFEWALKLKELTYVVAEPYSSADFQHGPIAMVEGGFPVLAIAASGKVFDSMMEMLKRLHGQHDAELVVISSEQAALSLAQSSITLPAGIPEWISPIVAIVAGQLFAYHLTKAKGYDAEKPRSIGKVTETH